MKLTTVEKDRGHGLFLMSVRMDNAKYLKLQFPYCIVTCIN